jgi:hypothetical protein
MDFSCLLEKASLPAGFLLRVKTNLRVISGAVNPKTLVHSAIRQKWNRDRTRERKSVKTCGSATISNSCARRKTNSRESADGNFHKNAQE